MNPKMTKYVAEDGKVFDYVNPKIATIKNLDGTISTEEQHLYVKYLFLGPQDSIENYKLVDGGTK